MSLARTLLTAFFEASLSPPDIFREWIQLFLPEATRVLQGWQEAALQLETSEFAQTRTVAQILTHLWELQDHSVIRIVFNTEFGELLYSHTEPHFINYGSYNPYTDIITVVFNDPFPMRVLREEPHFYKRIIHDLQFLLEHELVHREQLYRRLYYVTDRQEHPIPQFGIPKTTHARSAKSLVRRNMSPYGKYRGQPEEIMAWAQELALVLHSAVQRRLTSYSLYKAADIWVSTEHYMGKNSPAWKKFLQHTVAYLSRYGYTSQEIQRLFSRVKETADEYRE